MITREAPSVFRHKAAIKRFCLSKPVERAILDDVLRPDMALFDYGCGHGDDIRLLSENGYAATGWDPVLSPDVKRTSADCVNLGYVINVIENPDERAVVLQDAYGLAKKVLIVSAQMAFDSSMTVGDAHEDGVLTRRGTFQKYFTQEELGKYISGTLGATALPATSGVYYVFRDEDERQRFLINQVRRRSVAHVKTGVKLEKEVAPYRELLERFASHVQTLGRLPRASEFSELEQIQESLGRPERCLRLCERLIDGFDLGEARKRRADDLLVYIALSRFQGRPPFGRLPESLQWDIRDLFGSYGTACERGDQILFRAGRADEIDRACQESEIGKLLPNALYVLSDAEERLSPILRAYLGCGKAFLGEVPETNLLKIHRFTGKISYLSYPGFDRTPHPALRRSVSVNLRTRETWSRDYSKSTNPPILHRKETFVPKDYAHYAKFAKLTTQEEKVGLFEEASKIGFRQAWEALLEEKGVQIRGHAVRKTRKK